MSKNLVKFRTTGKQVLTLQKIELLVSKPMHRCLHEKPQTLGLELDKNVNED